MSAVASVRRLRRLTLALTLAPALAAAQPQLAASPTLVDFGNVGVNTISVPEPITVNNESGSDPLQITSVQLTGLYANQFAFTTVTTPKTIPASENLILTLVTYQPTTTGTHHASLVIATATEQATVALLGTGVVARIEVTPMAIAFGDVQVATTGGDSSIQIANTGTSTLTINSVALEGTNLDSFELVGAPTGGATVDVGGDVTFYAHCRPLTGGDLIADVLITSDSPGTPTLRVELACTGTVPNVAVTPGSASFGSVLAGGGAHAIDVTVTNTGTAMFSIDHVELLPASQTVFSVVTPANLDIIGGGSVTLTFQFEPATGNEGPCDATAIVYLTAGLQPVQIPLHGVGVAPHVAASPTMVVFGEQRVGTQGQQMLMVRNTGGAPLTLSAFTTIEAPFSILSPPTLPKVLQPNEELPLSIAFSPTDTGSAVGTLGMTTDDPDNDVLSIPLSGNGTAPSLLVTPTAIDFDPQRRTTTSDPQTITLANTGQDPLALTEVTLAGAGAAAFSLAGAPTSIEPGAASMLTVRFAPPSEGDYAATITITSDDPAQGAVVVNLTGSGTAPVLVVSPAETFAFPETYVGKKTEPVTFTITNGDVSPLPLGSIQFVTPSPDFVLEPGTVTGSLATGQSASFRVTFAPVAVGAKTAVIEVLLTGDSEPALAIAVSGTARSASTGGGCSAGRSTGAPSGLLLALLVLLAARRRPSG